jgi:hypothetical protein
MAKNKGVTGEGIEFLSYPSIGLYLREFPLTSKVIRADSRSHYSSLE